MAFNLEEQSQLAVLHSFWQRWSKWILSIIALALLAYLGYLGFEYYRRHQNELALQLYTQLTQVVQKQDLANVKKISAQIETDYGSTAYAANAAFIAAKAGVDKDDIAFAKSQLSWAVKHIKEPELVALAHLRLASLLLDAKQYDAALAQLNNPHDPSFDALFFDAKGDVFSLKGDKAAARDAYRAALAKLTDQAPNRQYIQLKLDALGT